MDDSVSVPLPPVFCAPARASETVTPPVAVGIGGGIVAGAAVQRVVAGAAVQRVVAVAAVQRVVAAIAVA